VARSLREGTLWVLGALALILLLALLSYPLGQTRDFGHRRAGPVGNWIGPVGAWLAGFFLFLFGRPAYLFPVMLAYAGWLVHKEQALPDARSRINTCCVPRLRADLGDQLRSRDLHWDPTGPAEQRRRRAGRGRGGKGSARA
jgi:DNA segregation ATPase FtsK/SpoIIIE-like protein